MVRSRVDLRRLQNGLKELTNRERYDAASNPGCEASKKFYASQKLVGGSSAPMCRGVKCVTPVTSWLNSVTRWGGESEPGNQTSYVPSPAVGTSVVETLLEP